MTKKIYVFTDPESGRPIQIDKDCICDHGEMFVYCYDSSDVAGKRPQRKKLSEVCSQYSYVHDMDRKREARGLERLRNDDEPIKEPVVVPDITETTEGPEWTDITDESYWTLENDPDPLNSTRFNSSCWDLVVTNNVTESVGFGLILNEPDTDINVNGVRITLTIVEGDDDMALVVVEHDDNSFTEEAVLLSAGSPVTTTIMFDETEKLDMIGFGIGLLNSEWTGILQVSDIEVIV